MKLSAFASGAALGISISVVAAPVSPENDLAIPAIAPPTLQAPAASAADSYGSDARDITTVRNVRDGKMARRMSAQHAAMAVTDIQDPARALARLHTVREMREAISHSISGERQAAAKAFVTRPERPGVELRISREDGAATFMRKGETSIIRAAAPEPLSEQSAFLAFANDNAMLFRLDGETNTITLASTRADHFGNRHYLYQQTVGGVPVRGAQVLAHFDAAGGLYAVTSRTQSVPATFDIKPSIGMEEATAIALAMFHSGHAVASEPVLEIRKTGAHHRLTYSVTSLLNDVDRWQTVVDARSGRIIRHYLDNHSAEVAASGQDLDGVTRNFTAWQSSGVNYMIDVTTPIDLDNEDPLNDESPYGDTVIYDLNNTEGTSILHVTSASASSGWDPTAVSAIHNGQAAYTYFKATHGRNGIDGNNGNILMGIHYGSGYDNAFWNGAAMIFGDGGELFSNLAACLDVIGHEMTHGVVSTTANLIYENQSGALNESMADFFGAMIEGDNWLLGEDCTVASPGFLRSMEDPHEGNQPSHMAEYVNLPNTEAGDNGGVHINSGIPNRAAYLLAEGLGAEGLGTSIGREKAEALYYRTLATYLVASSQFIDLRRGMLLSAEDLYPGDATVENAIIAAFDAVGITEGATETPDDSSPTDVDVAAGEDLLLYLYPGDEVYDGAEAFELWVQALDDPFSGYDPSNDFGPLNAASVAPTKAAAFTDALGTVLLYVGSDFNLYWIAGETVEQVTTGSQIWSLSASDDGRQLAYTSTFASDNSIYFLDVETGEQARYELNITDYQPEATDSGSRILFADALDFNYLGNRVVFDAFVCVPTPAASCDDAEPFGYWTVGILDVNTGVIRYPFAGQSPVFDIGYPTFAHNNEYIIAFDMVEYLDGGGIATASFTFNSETNAFPGLGVDRGVSVPGPEMWGVPAFLGDDEELIFQGLIDGDAGTGYVRISTVKMKLDSDFSIDFAAGAERMNHFESAFPVVHRAVYRDFDAHLTPGADSLDFGDVDTGEAKSLQLELSNDSDTDVVIYEITIDGEDFSHTFVNTRVPRNQSIKGTVTFNGRSDAGTSIGSLDIVTDAGEPLSISLSATVKGEPGDEDDAGNEDGDDDDGGDGNGSGGEQDNGGGGGGGGTALWLLCASLLIRRRHIPWPARAAGD